MVFKKKNIKLINKNLKKKRSMNILKRIIKKKGLRHLNIILEKSLDNILIPSMNIIIIYILYTFSIVI